ncbi:hypothetical protein [Gracilimonas sp.]|uniref:hypothetical protein n=1 Tax=Gracilimonas sp. TaxID=1974203 RepID=UPI002871E2B8|nr:hypothetical protein [Gracilimonas sp.]
MVQKNPLCDESFRDKRGLTSHARNKHDLEKDEVFEEMTQKEPEKMFRKLLGGFSALILALIGFTRLK